MQNSILQSLATKVLDRPLSPRELLRARKVVYIGLILVLFTGSFLWRRYAVEPQAQRLAILEESQGEVEVSSRVMQLSLTGLNGLVTCVLWNSAIDKQKKNQWNELEFIVRSLTRLQPHFITPWMFQSWNLAYNVPAMMDRVPDKYFYVTRGVELLWEGERQNQNNPDMRFTIGYTMQHKIAQSDQTNTLRSLFDLSKMPKSERNPARFRKEDGSINWDELEKFCKKNPQLVRRLHDGVRMETKEEQQKLFTCKDAEAVIDFLRENYDLPSLWTVVNGEDRLKKDLTDRFPVLPPYRESVPAPQHIFEPVYGFKELNDRSPLEDGIDVYQVARAWFGYAQEPIPDPDVRPGSTKPVVDRVRQRVPRYMATIIFRGYPALAQGQTAKRLQDEGWYDATPWEIRNWFRPLGGYFPSDRQNKARVAPPPGSVLSHRAWELCAEMWDKHGRENHLILTDAELENHKSDAEFMHDYNFARTSLGNFLGNHMRSHVEAQEKAVKARKTFYNAYSLYLYASPAQSLAEYKKPEGIQGWIEVLKENPDYRKDSFTQEETFETQLNYMIVLKLVESAGLKAMREDLSLRVAAAALAGQVNQVGLAGALAPVPLLRQKFAPNSWSEPIPQLMAFVKGPFDVTIKDEKGNEVPLLDPAVVRGVLERKNVLRPRPNPGPQSGPGPGPAGPPAPPAPGK